mmetsp:Transcript_129524/g.242307  ORF Transcript_129524/g.242307 Transcript_129524/m.242307 type:complete len:349 (+) Transcript_129524:144-1190(+)
MAFSSRCSFSAASLIFLASAVSIGADTTSFTPCPVPSALVSASVSSALTSSIFTVSFSSSSSSSFFTSSFFTSPSNSSLAAALSRTFSPPRLVAMPPLSKFRYMSAKPLPSSCFVASFLASLASCASSSSSNFLRRFNSSLKACVTKTSLSFLSFISFFNKRSSTICCSTLLRSTATITFSIYLASRFVPTCTASAPGRTVSPTRFFCSSASVRTICAEGTSMSMSRLTSSITSSYWKTLGSLACRASACRCACTASAVGFDQVGKPRAFLPPSASSSSNDSLKSEVMPPCAAFALLAAEPRATGGLLEEDAEAPGAPPAEGLKPKPANLPVSVFWGPSFMVIFIPTT